MVEIKLNMPKEQLSIFSWRCEKFVWNRKGIKWIYAGNDGERERGGGAKRQKDILLLFYLMKKVFILWSGLCVNIKVFNDQGVIEHSLL